MRGRRSRVFPGASLVSVVVLVMGLLLFVGDYPGSLWRSHVISGPYARLLGSATDLGPSHRQTVQLTAELRAQQRPAHLMDWAHERGLSVDWGDGDSWATVAGPPQAVSRAFAVPVHDYRNDSGEVFYASPHQASVPASLTDDVAELGRIMGYTPYRESVPPHMPRDVPNQGLLPTELLTTYGVNSLAAGGFTGKGVTVVVFAFDGFDQGDMDSFADWFSLPKFNPELMGDMPPQNHGEATMDLQMIHAIAPDAKTVLVNARPTVEGDGPYVKLGRLMGEVDRKYPGAVWSFSIGWGCDKLLTAADLAPVRQAVARAQRHGTSVFDASGDLAGLECKNGQDWSDRPSLDDVGVDAVASIPEITGVGGTTLSTDEEGNWLSEQAWYDIPLTQGSGGGASTLFARPAWQARYMGGGPRARRLCPDVAAVADPFTGVKFVHRRQVLVGGGTSQSAPIWAGIAAVMNQFLVARGVGLLGDLNPLLYEIAEGAGVPGFRTIELGANAVDQAHPGFDMVTGLGTPNAENLVKDLLVLKAAGR